MSVHYGIVIDQHRCIGCHTCSVACKSANNIAEGTWWNRVLTDGGDDIDTASGQYPNLSMDFVPTACQHCENPACTRVCPVGATYKDPETGVVRQDYDKCIGCRMCMAACPYTGVRSFNWEEPKYAIDVRTGDPDAPEHQKHVVEKCTMCWHRIQRGGTPACIELCPAKARFWGDLSDPNSEVSQLVSSRAYKQLLPDEDTKPSVYYLV